MRIYLKTNVSHNVSFVTTPFFKLSIFDASALFRRNFLIDDCEAFVQICETFETSYN